MVRSSFYSSGKVRSRIGLILLALLLLVHPTPIAATPPDQVLEWIAIMNDTVIAGKTNPLVTSRVVALVSASVFDAVN